MEQTTFRPGRPTVFWKLTFAIFPGAPFAGGSGTTCITIYACFKSARTAVGTEKGIRSGRGQLVKHFPQFQHLGTLDLLEYPRSAGGTHSLNGMVEFVGAESHSKPTSGEGGSRAIGTSFGNAHL